MFWQYCKDALGAWASKYAAQVLGPDEIRYWLELAGALIAIDLLYRWWNRSVPEPFPHPTPSRIYTHKSAILDYKFVVVDRLITASIVAPMILSSLVLGDWGSKLLAARLGPGPAWKAGLGALFAFAVIRLVLFDIGHYISHYLQHKVPFFWELHKVHHAAEVLTPVTAFRVHPLESVMDSVFQGPLQALGLAVFYYLYGGQQSVSFVGSNAIILFYYLIDNARHSHLWISFGPKLEHIFSSPAQHQIHHSSAAQHLDRNFSKYFSFLDWICGTLYIAEREEALDFGLNGGSDAELTTVWGLYWMPLKRAFGLLFRPSTASSAHVLHPTVSRQFQAISAHAKSPGRH